VGAADLTDAMLSRVADSLYWMSRYFERADNCARVIEATYSLMLNRTEVSADQRWYRALTQMGMKLDAEDPDPQDAIRRLAADGSNRASVVACLSAARDNASQVREEISSEMWEQLNRVYHEAVRLGVDVEDEESVMRLVAAVRDGSFSFHGVSESTMTHGEGWRFVQLGKFTERACAVSMLLDAYFGPASPADDFDWIALLTSCGAFDCYCRVFTADLRPDRIAELLLVHAEFPYSVRYSVERMFVSLRSITAQGNSRHRAHITRVIGRLRSSLAFATTPELLAGDLHAFLNGVLDHCRALHSAVHDAYIDYPIEIAFEG
jgi:uncharacterized alpha-E superfamily protein